MRVDDIIKGITERIISDGSADYIQLNEQLNFVDTLARLILGLMVIIIVIGIPLVVVVELVYINFPVFRDTYKKVTLRTSGRLNSTLGLVVRDARLAVEKSTTTDIHTATNLIYLKIKSKSIIISMILVGVVLGSGPYVIRIIVNITGKIIEGFQAIL